jgi:hypothetical protein
MFRPHSRADGSPAHAHGLTGATFKVAGLRTGKARGNKERRAFPSICKGL